MADNENGVLEAIPSLKGTVVVSKQILKGDLKGATSAFVAETTSVADTVAPVMPAARVVSAAGHGLQAAGHLIDGDKAAAVQEAINAVTAGKGGTAMKVEEGLAKGAFAEVGEKGVAAKVGEKAFDLTAAERGGAEAGLTHSADQAKVAAAEASRTQHMTAAQMEAHHEGAWSGHAKNLQPEAETVSGGAGTFGNHRTDVAVHHEGGDPLDGGIPKVYEAPTMAERHHNMVGPEHSSAGSVNVNKAQTTLEKGKDWIAKVNDGAAEASAPKQGWRVQSMATRVKASGEWFAKMGAARFGIADPGQFGKLGMTVAAGIGVYQAYKMVETAFSDKEGEGVGAAFVQGGQTYLSMLANGAMPGGINPMALMQMGGFGGAAQQGQAMS